MPVNTAKVEGRRKLDYASLGEMLDDADRLGSGPIKVLGNWSAGHGWMHILSDVGVCLAYLAISSVLVYFALRRPERCWYENL